MSFFYGNKMIEISHIKLFAFDLDGTLVDTERAYNYAWCKACNQMGFQLNSRQALFLRSCDAKLGYKYLSELFNAEFSYNELKKIRGDFMNDFFSKNGGITLKKGALNFVSYLKNKGKDVCIVSAATVQKIQETIQGLSLPFKTEELFSAKDVKNGKPYPDVYLKLSADKKITPDEIMVFEDSPNGVKSAVSAGCHVIFIPDLTDASGLDGIERVYSDFDEVLRDFTS